MFTEDRDYSDIAIGLIVSAIIIAGLISIAVFRAEPKSAATLPVAQHVEQDVAPQLEIVRSEPLQPRSSKVIAAVYECMVQGQRVLSDRPCASDAIIREIEAPNRMPVQDTSRLFEPLPTPSAAYKASPRSGASGSAVPGSPALCDSIETEIDWIDARMRQRYSNREGEFYRERLRQLKNQRWEAGCRHRR